MIGWGECVGRYDVVQTINFRKKEKILKNEKTGKTILRRFKGIKIFGWYSWSFLVLDALRTALKCLKSNFTVVCMVAKMCKGSKKGAKQAKMV